jgi:hypothetical protein
MLELDQSSILNKTESTNHDNVATDKNKTAAKQDENAFYIKALYIYDYGMKLIEDILVE